MGRLSGGEKARILIARLMLQTADLLILDEPTNDLDIPTLEVLEENLAEFPGALVLVTHDRFLLDRVSTSILALGRPDGRAGLFADYTQWENDRAAALSSARGAPAEERRVAGPAAARDKGLSYREKREWEQMEAGDPRCGGAPGRRGARGRGPRDRLRRRRPSRALRGAGGGARRGRAALRPLGGAGGEGRLDALIMAGRGRTE